MASLRKPAIPSGIPLLAGEEKRHAAVPPYKFATALPLFVVPVHRPTIAGDPHSRPEPILLRPCSALAMGLPRH